MWLPLWLVAPLLFKFCLQSGSLQYSPAPPFPASCSKAALSWAALCRELFAELRRLFWFGVALSRDNCRWCWDNRVFCVEWKRFSHTPH